METIAQEAKRLLEPIQEDQWITNTFSDYSNRCCAIGHHTRLKSDNPLNYSFENCHDNFNGELRSESEKFLDGIFPDSIVDVNNEITDRYPQKRAKQRVMALLDDMIKAGY